jgi:hypothetical protein
MVKSLILPFLVRYWLKWRVSILLTLTGLKPGYSEYAGDMLVIG